jgi:hypothetical protein
MMEERSLRMNVMGSRERIEVHDHRCISGLTFYMTYTHLLQIRYVIALHIYEDASGEYVRFPLRPTTNAGLLMENDPSLATRLPQAVLIVVSRSGLLESN